MKLSRQTRRTLRRAGKAIFPFTGVAFAVFSLLLLGWIGVHVHPGASASADSALGGQFDLVSELNAWSKDAKNSMMAKFTSSEMPAFVPNVTWKAPKPDPMAYQESYTAKDMLSVIEEARASGLLREDERIVFSLNADFYPNTLLHSYCDDSILVLCWKELIEGRVCSCCEIKIADASQFRRKLSQDTYGSPVKDYATELAAQTNAVVAMNADLYLQRDLGITVYNRDVYRFNEWFYTGKYNQYNCVDTLLIDTSGDFHFMKMGERRTLEDVQRYVKENDILFSIAFGPILVENGELRQLDWYPLGEINDQYSRAGFAQCGPLHYFYMTASHSEKNTPVCTINEFARLMHSKGVENAYAFDGGQTGELVFDGEPYNHIDFGAERTVSDIICFTTAITPGAGGKTA